jgi:trafficking protein particle complex subunit 10
MEEVNGSPAMSKVIIQCTDPDNVLESFETRFAPRTPLRSLHWKSPSRPLRSIPSLNVSLVRKEPAQNGGPTGARRHQIPGLRETPYLKLYLLRCDDKESYKESARKEIKQWIKENTLEKERKSVLRNQEHHDAYEWMIVHVVLPNTAAASQPKSSKHISLEATESTDSVNSKSKWTGKSTSTILDRLRADFASSKSSIPRVAQVRIIEQGKPAPALSPAEIEEQWQDLIDNIKAAILSSFDTRVSQYEEDIRERENQRSLPGWNFCTFFVLKEGLARGFENVGLLVDALAVYSELEIGLDLILKEASKQDEVDGPGALLPYAKDLKSLIRKALDEASQSMDIESNGQSGGFTLNQILTADSEQLPFDIGNRDYRDLILKNQVSALDLRIFMFTRKMEILLQQAGMQRAGQSAYPDLNMLADFVEMALGFINQAAREYRADLHAAWGGRLSGSERAMQRIVIGNVVATWSWSAVKQILNRVLPLLDHRVLTGEEDAADVLASALQAYANEIPQRSASSQDRRSSSSNHTSPSQELRSQSLPRIASISKDSLEVPGQKTWPLQRPGMERLYTWTARLFLLARTILEGLPSNTAWTDQLNNIELPGRQQRSKRLHRHSSYGADSLLNGDPTNNQHLCLDSPTLKQASASKDSFSDLYQLLTACTCSLLVHTGQDRILNALLTELAGQAYTNGERDRASQYLSRALDGALKEGLAANLSFATALYAECLDSANRPNDYARCLLACLQSTPAQQCVEVAQNYFDRLIEIADSVEPLQLPLSAVMKIEAVDKAISHSEEYGGFHLSVRCQSRLQVALGAMVSLKLYLSAAGDHEPQSICLAGPHEFSLSSSGSLLTFASKIETQGWYLVDRLEMCLGQLSFIQSFRCDPGGGSSTRSKHDVPSVMLYPRNDVLEVELTSATVLSLAEAKLLSLRLKTGASFPSTCSIGLRSASAGLRLSLQEGTSTTTMTVSRRDGATLFYLENIPTANSTEIQIPYTLESGSDTSITIKCEVSYYVNDEMFTYYKTCNVDVLLPIAVNVQDIHRSSHWYSKFFIRSSRLVPIVLWGCSVDEDTAVTIVSAPETQQPIMVFPQQPAVWTARLSQEDQSWRPKLTLDVRYQCLDELVVNTLRHSIESALNDLQLPGASSLLSGHLIETVRNRWTEQDLEVAGLTRELEMWPMKDLDWHSILCAFDQITKQKIKSAIEKWHSATEIMTIGSESAPVRRLKLQVELPLRPPVIETGIVLKAGSTTAPVGQPLICEVVFHVWMDEDTRIRQEHDFSYELFAPQEVWVMGGRKKGKIQSHSERSSVKVILFPQRSGTLLLPTIDVRCRRQNEKAPAGREAVDVPIEVYNRTLSRSLLITQNLQSTTIGMVSEEGMQTSNGMMINSKSRTTNTWGRNTFLSNEAVEHAEKESADPPEQTGRPESLGRRG